MLLLEDIHWADDLSVEAFAHLARRLPQLPLLVVAAFRSDELYPNVPLRAWRSALVNERLAEEVRLSRFSAAETAVMANAIAGQALPSDWLRSCTNEAMGSRCTLRSSLPSSPIEPRRPPRRPSRTRWPTRYLRRAEALSPPTRSLAEVAAVIGRSFELDLLVAVGEVAPDRVGIPLRELESRFFVLPTADGRGYDFRHALIRDALYGAIPLSERRLLHGRVADALTSGPVTTSDAVLSVHLEAAGRRDAAYRHALAGAINAAQALAHRDAAALYERALRNQPDGTPAADRAPVLLALADEAAAVDDNERAATRYAESSAAFVDAGDALAAAALLPRLAAARHLVGADLGERVALLQAALATATETAASDPAVLERAAVVRTEALAGLAAAYMLDRRLDDAIHYAELARVAATERGLLAAGLNASTTLAAVLVIAGRGDEGFALLEDTIARARTAQLETEAARAYRMLGSTASVLVEYERAEHWLPEGIRYAERVELWNHRHYLAAHLAHVLWATGDWTRAEEVAHHALTDGRGGITTRVTALHVLGYVALGRGRFDAARVALDEARAIGERMAELQRISPAVWGLAECALLEGRPEDAVAACRNGLELSAAVDDASYLFPYLVTGTRAYLAVHDPAAAARWCEEVSARLTARSIAGTLPAIAHARGLVLLAQGATGKARTELDTALAGWRDRRRWWEGTRAMLDLARCHRRANSAGPARALAASALERARAVGSDPLVAEAEALLTAIGARHGATEPWTPLTAREYEVARLIAGGRTNLEIATELGIAPKTASAHVEHILAKLGLTRRAEVAAWVASIPRGGGSGS